MGTKAGSPKAWNTQNTGGALPQMVLSRGGKTKKIRFFAKIST